jgi:hypothetical protein
MEVCLGVTFRLDPHGEEVSENARLAAGRTEEQGVAQRKKVSRRTKEGDHARWLMIATLYALREQGWNLMQLVEACDIDPKDVVRWHKDAAKGFVFLRQMFPDGNWPVLKEVPVHIVERKPKGHEDEVIVFKPFRDPTGKVRAKWHSLAPTFIDEGKPKHVRSRGPSGLVGSAFKKAHTCARQTPGILAIWVDDPQGHFPLEARPKFKDNDVA